MRFIDRVVLVTGGAGGIGSATVRRFFTIAFLASDEAGYICGALVEITGAKAVP